MQACPANPPSGVPAEALFKGSRASVRSLSPAAMTLFGFAGSMLIAASSSAVTPLYRCLLYTSPSPRD